MSTLAVVEEVLRVAATPLSAVEIVAQAGDRLPTLSRRPQDVVSRDLSMDIVLRGDASRFHRVARGRYMVRDSAAPPTPPAPVVAVSVILTSEEIACWRRFVHYTKRPPMAADRAVMRRILAKLASAETRALAKATCGEPNP